MNPQEAEFLQRLRATFRVEADELLQIMSSRLIELEQAPPGKKQSEWIEVVFRHAHSLKGAARAVNLLEIESVCQILESFFATWKQEEISPVHEQFDTLLRAVDWMTQAIPSTDGQATAVDKARFKAVVTGLNALIAGLSDAEVPDKKPAPAKSSDNSRREAAPTVDQGTQEILPPGDTIELRGQVAEAAKSPVEPAAAATEAAPVPGATTVGAKTVRISTNKLDQLLLETEEMLGVKLAFARQAGDLREFQPFFARWNAGWARIQPHIREVQASAVRQQSEGTDALRSSAVPGEVIQFLDWSAGNLKMLEGKLQALEKIATRDQTTVGRQVENLLDHAKQLLMLPFSTVLDPFPKLVRDLSRDQGKEVELLVRGGEVEMDKRILETMKDALIHLVRNCIDHGIERPAARSQKNKRPRATLTIAVSRLDGGRVEILVSDDGAGINREQLKAAAVKRGIITAVEAGQMEDPQVLALIFQSEVSTSPILTEISGRGLGMAIVREKTEQLEGRVSVTTEPDAGTTFRMVLPALLATFRGILVRVARQDFVLPTANVERVTRVKPAEIKTVGNRETMLVHGQAVSLARLETVLELPSAGDGIRREHLTVVLLASGDERIAFSVDEILDEEEFLVKTLASPLVRVRNLAGATILGSGKVVPVLNVTDLMKAARKTSQNPATSARGGTAAKASERRRRILVAEDSITSRMLLKNIMESAGHEVKTAVDGVEALTELRTGDFDLVVSDVEMPRMNGFDLTAQIRNDRKLADKPVILVTALASREHRERGVDVGASAYIVKSSFDQSNLLEAIRRLT